MIEGKSKKNSHTNKLKLVDSFHRTFVDLLSAKRTSPPAYCITPEKNTLFQTIKPSITITISKVLFSPSAPETSEKASYLFETTSFFCFKGIHIFFSGLPGGTPAAPPLSF